MKEMHQSHVSGIFLGWSPKTFGCFIRVICIALAHFIPWRHYQKKNGLVISFRCWEPALVPCCADCHLPREQKRHQGRKLELVKKKKENHEKTTAVTVLSHWDTWESECNESLLCTWAGWTKLWNKLYHDWEDQMEGTYLGVCERREGNKYIPTTKVLGRDVRREGI